MYDDPTGHWLHILAGAIIGAAVNVAATAVTDYVEHGKFTLGGRLHKTANMELYILC